MKKGYDNVSFFYDGLSRMVFGKRLLRAQQMSLGKIAAPARILIIGGGSGWILGEICNNITEGLEITYADAAPKMIAQAKKRDIKGNTITFIALPIEKSGIRAQYDFVITPFLFDNFTEGEAARIFAEIHNLLKPGGYWLFTDFQQTSNWWYRSVLKCMYIFFGLFCGIKATRLPGMEGLFKRYGYRVEREGYMQRGFVVSRVYTR